MMKRMQAAFTLIELIVVTRIIGILAPVPIPQLTNVERDAKGAVARAVCGSRQCGAVMLYAWNRAADSYTTIQGQVTTSAGSTAGGGTAPYLGTCAAPTVAGRPTGSASGTTISCAAIPAAVCN